ncbi:MAG: hypothetical protein WD595_00935, partial [Waddliaceae bacterium]
SDVEEAVIALLLHFPVYRTYLPESGHRLLKQAIQTAKADACRVNPRLWDDLETLFLKSDSKEARDLVKKFQQTSGPIMAKGMEDTAFYRYFPLASLNEVGGEPDRFGIPRHIFYQENIKRQKKTPFSLSATTTHDTKRSEDVRARLNVLSEIPQEWKMKINQWGEWNTQYKTGHFPDKSDEYLLYQTIVGTFPVTAISKESNAKYITRIQRYILKAVKEAKQKTSWIEPNTAYEDAIKQFTEAILQPTSSFYKDLEPFVKRIAPFGFCNSLAQTLIKITTPGIPDFYQGTETWAFTLVDPDNRERVDFTHLSKLSRQLENYQTLSQNVTDERLKLYVTKKALECRQRCKQLFQEGDFIPLTAIGKYENHLIAYARSDQKQSLITLCGRFLAAHALKMNWKETAVKLPGKRYKDHITGKTLYLENHMLKLNDIFDPLPIALLEEI